jgi:hypothetical protein
LKRKLSTDVTKDWTATKRKGLVHAKMRRTHGDTSSCRHTNERKRRTINTHKPV